MTHNTGVLMRKLLGGGVVGYAGLPRDLCVLFIDHLGRAGRNLAASRRTGRSLRGSAAWVLRLLRRLVESSSLNRLLTRIPLVLLLPANGYRDAPE